MNEFYFLRRNRKPYLQVSFDEGHWCPDVTWLQSSSPCRRVEPGWPWSKPMALSRLLELEVAASVICSAFDRLQTKCPNLNFSSDTERSMLWARIDDLPSYWRTSGASRALRSLQKAVWASSKRWFQRALCSLELEAVATLWHPSFIVHFVLHSTYPCGGLHEWMSIHNIPELSYLSGIGILDNAMTMLYYIMLIT